MAARQELETTAAELIPPNPTIEKLRSAAAGCTASDLHLTATQTCSAKALRRQGAFRRRVRRAVDGPSMMATVHLSSILRARDAETREGELADSTADLSRVADVMKDNGELRQKH